MRSALKASTASPVLLMCSKRPRIYPQGYTHTPPLPSQSPSLLPKLETSDPPGLLRLPQGPRGFPTSSFCPVSAVTVQNLIFSSLSSGTSLLVSLPLPFPIPPHCGRDELPRALLPPTESRPWCEGPSRTGFHPIV